MWSIQHSNDHFYTQKDEQWHERIVEVQLLKNNTFEGALIIYSKKGVGVFSFVKQKFGFSTQDPPGYSISNGTKYLKNLK